jgi:hypothetical protein
MDPKQVSTKRSDQALGWLRQNMMVLQASMPAVEVRKAVVQISYRTSKA